jgi:hypothetical protein
MPFCPCDKEEAIQVRERKLRLPTDTKSEMGLAGEWSNPGYGAGMFPDVSSIIEMVQILACSQACQVVLMQPLVFYE